MPQIKRHFRGGRMNKDLDERLIPNGEYRDAQNIEIVTSEGSHVGSIQNLLGNILKNRKDYNTNTNVGINWSSNYISNLSNPVCIGSLSDTSNEKIYWFIASDSVSCVAEYNSITEEIKPVLVDTQDILKFSSKYLITGINIIEGLLAWTDNQTDPKIINIDKFKSGCSDFNTHTVYDGTLMSASIRNSYVSGSTKKFNKTHITTIKLSPRNAPVLTTSSSIRPGNGTGNSYVYTSFDFSNIGIGETVTLTLSPTPVYIKDDKIILTTTYVNSDNTEIDYEVEVLIRELLNGSQSVSAELISLPSDLPIGSFQYKVILSEGEPLFKEKFVRFAYRWKYIDGQYSTFSPFSEIAFIPSEFKYKSTDGFNDGMSNTLRSLLITITDEKPFDVDEVDILYKESNSNPIYIVSTIKDGSSTYSVDSEVLGLMLPSNQILRPWDNVPLKAKAQESVGNRIIYANYVQNYDIFAHNVPDISTTISTQPRSTAISFPEKSVKSQRTYQIGVVYSDLYGRETPVFSSKKSSFTLDKSYAKTINKISCQLNNIAPDWATHYKYFLKETSNEYYNIALDRFYFSDDNNIWLSFPSSERNKVLEDSYLILKKQHDTNNFVTENAKYKILDISNEAPNSLTKEVNTVASSKCYIFSDGTGRPSVNSTLFKFRGPTDIQNPDFARAFGSLSYISITTYKVDGSIEGTTDKYKVVNGGITSELDGASNLTTVYEVQIEEPIKESESVILNTSLLAANAKFKINVHMEESFYKPEFSGRFFVKINRDSILDKNIIDSFKAIESKYSIVRYNDISLDTVNDFSLDNEEISKLSWIDTKAEQGYTLSNAEHPVLNSNKFSIILAGVDTGENDVNHYVENKLNAFLSSIQSIGSYIQFSNSSGFSGDIYKIKAVELLTYYRTDSEIKRKKISGKSRRYEITIENVYTKGGYEDPFVLNGTNETAIISKINIMQKALNYYDETLVSDNPAIFEIEPRTPVDLDLYYEVSNPLGIVRPGMFISTNSNPLVTENKKEITSISRSSSSTTLNLSTAITAGTYYIHSSDGLYNFNVSGTISGSTFILNQSSKIHGNVNSLDWFNCFSFGQGVESNRIKDDFNAPFMDKGPIVSSTISSQYKQDLKKSGFIWSGIINSISGINDLNQFIQAETITKEINPGYGSIQKLLSRDTDLIAFCEDKILRILSNKDAIYNANGNINLISVDSVLGQAVPYLGEYGVSKNPESVADFGFRIYFTDKVRGLVLRLSRDGITEISDKGMTNWFSTNLRQASVVLGSFNDNKGCYDLTLNNYTLSFDERVDGWTSFKSFLPENSVSLNNIYYTFKNGELWSHTSTTRNNFYNVQYDSSITTIFNDVPSSIKSFKTINYEGSLSRKYSYNGNNSSYTKGWYCNSILTEKQTGSIKEFKKQEDLWSNYILGDSTNIVNINTKEFTVQGIGSFASIDNSERTQAVVTVGFVLETNNDGIILPQDFTFNQAINTSSDKSFSVIIKPSDGYSILYNNFQATDTTFTQDGNNIIASVQKNYTTVISNVVDTITITATSSLIENTLSTSYETVYKNTSQSSIISSPTIYSNTPGTTAQIFTHTVNSSSGYVFSTEPKAVILTSNGTSGTSMYSITNNWSANATEVIFTINYIFGLTNVIGDKLLFIAEATKQYVSPGLKITSIYVPTKTISKFGETRTINIIGSPGATFTLKRSQQARDIINNNLSGSAIIYFLQVTNLWDSAETTLTIPASGVYSFSEKYVEASDNYYYSYLVTATDQSTRDGSFYGRNYVDNTYDVLVKQILDVTLYIDFNSDNQSSYYTINPSSQSTNYSITSSYGLHEPKSGSSKALISVTKTIRSTDNYTLSEIRTPDYYDFRFTTSRVALTDPSTSFNQLKIYSNNFIGYDSIQTGSIATWTDAAGTYKERKVDSLNEPYRTQVILETSGEFDGNENDPHSLPTGSFVTFIADNEWEFNIKNISTILSADNRDYTITFDVEVAKYGLANLYSYIDLTNFIQATIISSPTGGATAPPTTSKRRSLVAIENDIQISSISFYTGNLSIYTNSATTQTVGGTGTPPAGTGIITGNFSGNALSQVGLTATADDGAVVTGFTIGSLYFPNITNTTGDPNWGWSISGGTYYGGQNSTIMFTWEANIAANITLSSNLGVNFDLTLVNYP